MISPKFVNIAREVIKFIQNGGRLGRVEIYKDGKYCPLGAVCINAKLKYNANEDAWYDYALSKTGLRHSFYSGFDRYGRKNDEKLTEDELSLGEEDFQIGYRLAEFCSKRDWL